MRLPPLLIAGSLLVNVALALVLSFRAAPESATSRASSSSSSSLTPSAAKTDPPNPVPADAARAIDPATWAKLNPTERADFVARLRAEGFPASVIRALVRQLVQDHFRARYQALAEAEAAKPYWRGNGRYSNDAKLNAERRALGRESQAMLKELLGDDAHQPTTDQLVMLQNRFGNLPPTKLAQIQSITADYTDLSKQVSEAADGILLPQDRATLALLQKEREADIVRLLSPEEVLEYELHHSSTANRLIAQLSAFDATETEFRALFALTRAVDAAHGNPGVLNPEQRRARADAMKQLTPQIEAALGPERFAEYQRAIDPNYQQAVQLVTRLELPKAAAAQVFTVQQEVEQRLAALRADRALGNAARQAQFAALHAEATAKLTSTLGARGLEAYKESGGFWLENLQRQATMRPAPKSAPPTPAP